MCYVQSMSKVNQRLAMEARKLAMECAEGTAPEFGTESSGTLAEPNCAMGHMISRAGLEPSSAYYWMGGDCGLVLIANDFAKDHADRQSRLVFPLLALAEELEELP